MTPLKSGTTEIRVYLKDDPSVCKTRSLKIVLQETAEPTQPVERADTRSYVLNTNTKKFHYPSCKSVNQMKERNKRAFTGTREAVLSMGYKPCGNCHP